MRMSYLRTTGGRPEPTSKELRRRRTSQGGDCGVIAVATATGLTYQESRRRLKLTDQTLLRARPLLLVAQQRFPSVIVPEYHEIRNPTQGTNALALETLLAIHSFNGHQPDQCLQQDNSPKVILGKHGNTPHALPTRAHRSHGTADPSTGPFKPFTAWALNTTLTTAQQWSITKTFETEDNLYHWLSSAIGLAQRQANTEFQHDP